MNYSTNLLGQASNKVTQFGISPNYSYFIADKMDVGADLNYTYNSSFNTPNYDPEKQTLNEIGGEVFLRKYFMVSDKFGFRAGPYVGYEWYKNSYSYVESNPQSPTHTSSGEIYGGAKLDMVYYPLKHLGLSATLANAEYAHEKNRDISNGATTVNYFNFTSITSQLSIGVFYVFGRK